MNMNAYLVVWDGRKCVEIKNYGDDSKACIAACDKMNEPLERGIVPNLTGQTYYASSDDALGIYEGYERDEHYRDEMDWSSDMADGDLF